MRFNFDMTQEQLLKIKQDISRKRLSFSKAAEIIGVHQSTVSSWFRSKRYSMWQLYQRQKDSLEQGKQDDWKIMTPEGSISTYRECAKRLGITVGSLAKRIRKYGVEHPRVWTVGKNIDHDEGAGMKKNSAWEGLSSKSRDERLKTIPGPTRFERKLWKNW